MLEYQISNIHKINGLFSLAHALEIKTDVWMILNHVQHSNRDENSVLRELKGKKNQLGGGGGRPARKIPWFVGSIQREAFQFAAETRSTVRSK